MVHIERGYLPTSEFFEPAMFLHHAGRVVAIGLSTAFRFLDDAEAIKKATAYAIHLYGHDATKSEIYKLITTVTNQFRFLISMPPAPLPATDRQVVSHG